MSLLRSSRTLSPVAPKFDCTKADATPITVAFLVAVAFFLLARTANGQTVHHGDPDLLTCSPAPCVLPPTLVSDHTLNTPFIAADPVNPTHLLLGLNDLSCYAGASYTSKDGGSTWSSPFCMPWIAGNPDYRPGGSPTVGYDRNSLAYITLPYSHTIGIAVRGFIGFLKSSNGIDWSEPEVALHVVGSFAYYNWLAVDTNVGSPYLNSLYTTAVVVGPPADQSENRVIVSHSNDGGATWIQVPVARVQVSPDVDSYANMTVGKDGTVYLAWMYCNSGPYFCDNDRAFMVFAKSTDGGNTWSKPTVVAKVLLNHEGIPNTQVGAEDYPAIAIDNSNGPYAGNLYVSMYSWTGTYLRVQVVRSTDGGQTWSKPVPVAPPSDNHDQFFPWLSVSPTGWVGVSWLDRRNDPANVKYQAFAAISSNGGQSFQPNVQLTTTFSDPGVNGTEWMGNYTTNAWAGPNFVAAWMDGSNGFHMQVMVGGIRVK